MRTYLVKREAYLFKRFELSVRDERRFTNDEDRTRWAADGPGLSE
jgi:hypothetical protein